MKNIIYSTVLMIAMSLCDNRSSTVAFSLSSVTTMSFRASSSICSSRTEFEDTNISSETTNRRSFIQASFTASLAALTTSSPLPASAVVYLDPAMYGDQENRVSTVDSLREAVRRAILKNPELTSSFYILSLLDALSYDTKSGDGGPDGRVIRAVLGAKDNGPYMANLKQAATAIVDAKKSLKKLTAITIADAVAIGGASSIEAIGGPVISVQLGRTDAAPDLIFNSKLPLTLFDGSASNTDIIQAFRRSGLTERELTALISCLYTITSDVKANGGAGALKKNEKPQYRERGKMGRMSEFKKLSDEDIEAELAKDGMDDDDDESYTVSGDDGWYIADSFGTRDQAFGARTGSLDAKNFNKYVRDLNTFVVANLTGNKQGKSVKASEPQTGWVGSLLLDADIPSAQSWLAKYSTSNLNYQKDLGIAYNSMTQLGAEFTGGKYENLLKNKKRKTLNDE